MAQINRRLSQTNFRWRAVCDRRREERTNSWTSNMVAIQAQPGVNRVPHEIAIETDKPPNDMPLHDYSRGGLVVPPTCRAYHQNEIREACISIMPIIRTSSADSSTFQSTAYETSRMDFKQDAESSRSIQGTRIEGRQDSYVQSRTFPHHADSWSPAP